MVEFFKDFIAESKRVVWPNRQELIGSTLNVLGLSLIVAVIIYIMDFLVNGGISILEKFISGLL